MIKKKLLLCILDGFGIGKPTKTNAFFMAVAPCLKGLLNSGLHSQLTASEEEVGLPMEQFGNSEVGHSIIGTGVVKEQNLVQVSNAIATGSITQSVAFKKLMGCNVIHLVCMLSNGGVHSHQEHLFGIIKLLSKCQCSIWLHLISDGRDVPPNAMLDSINELNKVISKYSNIKVATLCGRYYAMDRDNRLERTEIAAKLLLNAGGQSSRDLTKTIVELYTNSITDEFIKPFVFNGFKAIAKTDGVFFINFRADRMRQLVRSVAAKNHNVFAMLDYFSGKGPVGVKVVLPNFNQLRVEDTLGGIVATNGLKQIRIAETEKYAHVTYFFNSGTEAPLPREDRVLVPSPRVATYDLMPQMSAEEVANATVNAINSDYNFIVVNFANFDMVGHTGDMSAAVKAVEFVDQQIERILVVAAKNNCDVIITSDHGNIEEMMDSKLQIHTQHTINPVPFIYVPYAVSSGATISNGTLANIAPTVLYLFGLQKPQTMKYNSLISL